jgi:hypothetical protein
MQIITYIVAFALVLLGGEWILKWLGVVPGSLVGDSRSGLFGAVLVLVGLILLLRRRSSA